MKNTAINRIKKKVADYFIKKYYTGRLEETNLKHDQYLFFSMKIPHVFLAKMDKDKYDRFLKIIEELREILKDKKI